MSEKYFYRGNNRYGLTISKIKELKVNPIKLRESKWNEYAYKRDPYLNHLGRGHYNELTELLGQVDGVVYNLVLSKEKVEDVYCGIGQSERKFENFFEGLYEYRMDYTLRDLQIKLLDMVNKLIDVGILYDEQGLIKPREELEIEVDTLKDRIEELESKIKALEGVSNVRG